MKNLSRHLIIARTKRYKLVHLRKQEASVEKFRIKFTEWAAQKSSGFVTTEDRLHEE